MIRWYRLGVFLLCVSVAYPDSNISENLFNLDIESLSQIKVSDDSITLIGVDRKYVPSMVTTITQDDIKNSGARSLDELLEIYVPDVAYMFKVDGNQLGIAGIISDRNNKILLTLNGKVLNIKGTDGGAVAERWLSMLGDIEEIQVISGPGSVIYGPGAIAGVINIKTFNADTFDGLVSTVKAGYGENFGSVDVKYGTKFENGMGLFVYAGIDRYRGIDKKDVINKFAFDYPKKDIYAYRNFSHPLVDLNGAYEGQQRKKLYMEFSGENFSLWSRYVKGGLKIPTYQQFYIFLNPEDMIETGSENEQWSNNFTYRQQLDDLTVEYVLTYIRSELKKRNQYNSDLSVGKEKKQNEDITDFKILATYEAETDSTYALGVEYSYNRFLHYQNDFVPFFNKTHSWHTGLFSLYGEMHRIDGQFETTADLRLDKHTYTDNLFSYRVSEIYKIDRHNTLKVNYSHSVRHMDEIDMYRQVSETHQDPNTESIDRIETIYSYDVAHWSNYFKCNYNIHDIIAYNGSLRQTNAIGTAKFYTIEGNIEYRQESYRLSLSHTYTSLIDFKTIGTVPMQNISAAPYGYGNDFANWHNHITKLRFSYLYDESLSFLGSLRLFWGMPGAIDMADYNKNTFPLSDTVDDAKYYRLPVYKNNTKAFGFNAYLNLSFIYKIDDQTTLYLHGYNLLGLFDKDINKRNYFQSTSNYLDEAPAAVVSLEYKFH